MTASNKPGRSCLFPSGIDPLQLYWSQEVLSADVERCRERCWQIVELDSASWPDPDAAHTGLAEQLQFPSYYGRNLDALDDAMAGVAEGRYGFAPDAIGGVLVFTGIEQLVATQPPLASVLVEVLATTVDRALRFGWPMACFLQSNDPDLRLDTGTPAPVGWNRSERARAKRQV